MVVVVSPEEQVDILERVIARLQPRGAWCRLFNAKDATGISVSPQSRHAVCWCLNGAIKAECTGRGAELRRQIICDRLRDEIDDPRMFLTEWNDVPGRTKGQVIALLRRVIKKLKKQAQAASA